MSGSYVRLQIGRRRVVVLLGTAGLLLFTVYLHSQSCKGVLAGMDYRHSAEQQDTSKVLIMSPDDQVARDLHLCEHVDILGDITSKYHQTILNFYHILQRFIPSTFSQQFRNPCWYSHYPYTITKNTMCKKVPEEIKILEHFNENRHSDHLYCLPSFFLAGFPKCASTTLYDMIIQHPDITPPECKEGQFWPVFLERGEKIMEKIQQIFWYFSHFDSSAKSVQSKPQAITLDASTHTLSGYIFKERTDSEICLAPSLIKHILPKAKFIVIMRDPTQRLFSDYWFECSFSKAWKSAKDPVRHFSVLAQDMFHNITAYAISLYQSCIGRGYSKVECVHNVSVVHHDSRCKPLYFGAGMYYYHIIPWLSVFPRERFLFIKTEELISSPDAEMKKVWAFLGLHNLTKTEHKFSNPNKWIGDSKYKSQFTMLPQTKQMLDTFHQPHNELLAHLLSDSKYMWSEVP